MPHISENKKRILITVASVLVIVACAVGGTVAYLMSVTPPVTNDFTYATVSCEVTAIIRTARRASQ